MSGSNRESIPSEVRFSHLDLVDWSQEEDFVRQLKATVAPLIEENHA